MTDTTDLPAAQGFAVRGTRREMLIGGALLTAAGVAFARMPRRHEFLLGSARLEDLVPKAFRGWQFRASSGLILPPPDQLRDTIYNQVVTRVYARGDAEIMFLAAYSGAQDGLLQVHRPEICYPAAGFAIARSEGHVTQLAPHVTVRSRAIVAESAAATEQLIYWTRLGSHFPTSWAEQRLAVVQENLAGGIPDGILVRISTRSPGDAVGSLDGFAADLYQSVGARMRSVLVGTSGGI